MTGGELTLGAVRARLVTDLLHHTAPWLVADTGVVSADEHKPNVTYSAPIGSVDLRAFQDDGSSYEVWPCNDCLPWHTEVVRVEGEILVREWHAVDCPQFVRLVSDD